MFKRIYLHIGTEKTGSTSIQTFLTQNRDQLRGLGFLYPACFHLANQIGLAAYAAPAERLKELLPQIGVAHARKLPEYREELERNFAEEVAAFTLRDGTLLLSNEHLHSRVSAQSEIERLRDLLGRYSADIRVLVYLRRQDLLAVSLVSTLYKAGHTKPWHLPEGGPNQPRYYDYATLLRNYGAVFGEENCIVRLFEPSRFVGGELIQDYAATTGLTVTPDMVQPPRQNMSVSSLGMSILAELNKHIPSGRRANPRMARGELVSTVTRDHLGQAALITRGQARAFYERFREGNAWVRQRYFPDLDRPTLFDESFERYPETLADERPTFEQGCEVAAQLWVNRSQVVSRARFQLKRRDAALEALRTNLLALADTLGDKAGPDVARPLAAALYAAGSFDRALPLARRAVAANPSDPFAHLVLGQALARAGDHEAAVPELQAALAGGAEPENASLDLAEALRWLNRLDEARAVVEAAASRYPADRPLQRLRVELVGPGKPEPANDQEGMPAQSSAQ